MRIEKQQIASESPTGIGWKCYDHLNSDVTRGFPVSVQRAGPSSGSCNACRVVDALSVPVNAARCVERLATTG
ncbi:hypothetical protein [Thioflavicoccus mobilis]|uniref:hypothetical protein n=1 Tax=Thioflavicoccus mobilis TaxID=80679 RepID=UPI0012FB9E72|nr:hypothetical protein [Thioflavicoccus mobilis]